MSDVLIHPTAIISGDAVIGAGTRIGPYAVIGPRVTIGRDCEVGSHACLDGVLTLGDRNRIGRHSCVGAAPQDMGYKGEETFLIVGNDNYFGDYVQLCRGTTKSHDRTTRIGNGNFIMAYCHVAHDCLMGDHNVIANGVHLAGHVEMEDHVHVGGISAIHQFCLVGRFAMISGATGVDGHVPPYVRVAEFGGVVRGINAVGLKRSKQFTDQEQSNVKAAYKAFFRGLGTAEEKRDRIAAQFNGDRHVEHFCKFLERCTQGTAGRRPICRERSRDSDE